MNVLPSRRSDLIARTALSAEPVRKLSFTGSTEVGRILLHHAADRVVSCSMELGGNAPVLIFDDADLDLVLEATLTAKMRHNAEACTAANRIYAHESVASNFAQRLGVAMTELQLGPGIRADTQMGPLIDADARDRLAELVRAALDDGARAVVGAKAPSMPGFFYEATVLDNVSPTSSILNHELFGPAAPVVSFGDEDDLIEMANSSEHGLMSYVFTSNLGRAMRVAEQLESGMVAVNRGVISDPAAPFGGAKQSGLGREGGHEGVLEYLKPKYIGVGW